MFNKLSETKFFNLGNAKYNYYSGLSKVNLADYYIPKDFYIDKVKSFKGFKYPMAAEIVKAIDTGKIIPVDFNMANNKSVKVQNMRTFTKWPSCVYSMDSLDVSGKPMILMDLSAKGKYSINPTSKEAFYYNIDDITLFAMSSAAYINYKLSETPEVCSNPAFFTLIGEAYALIMDKVFSLIISTNSVIDTGKIHLLAFTFCLQNMFGIDKNTAIKYAKKSKFISDKNNVEDSSFYCQSNEDFMENCDYNTVFPIDRFCYVITKEFTYITPQICNAPKIVTQFDDWFNHNAIFTPEHSKSFITMLVFAKYGIDIYNNFRLKQFLAANSSDIVKEIAQIIH